MQTNMSDSDGDGNDGGSQSPIASFLGMDRSSFLVADRSMFLQNYSTAPATLPDLWSEGGGDPLMGVSSTSSSSSSSMQPSQFAYSSNTSLAASLSFPSGSGQVVSPLQQQQQQSVPSASQMIRNVGVANPLATSVVTAQTQQQSLSRTLQLLQQQQQMQQQPQQMQSAPLPRMMMDQQQQQMMLLHQQQQLQQQLQQQQQQVPFLNFPQQPGRVAQSTSSLELQASSLAAAAATAAVGSSTSRSTARGRGGGGGGGGKGDPLGSSSSLSSALTSAALGGRSGTGSASATTAAATAAAIERRSGGKHAVEEHEESEDAEDDDLDDDLDDAGGSSKKKPRSSSSGGDKVAQSRERNKIHARKSRLRKKFLLDNLKANLGGVEEENENLRMMVVKLTGKTYEELMADSAAGLPMVAIAPPISTAGMAAAAASAAAQAAQSQGVVVSSPRIAPISSGLALGGLVGGGGGGGFAVQLQPVASSSSNPFAQALTQPGASSSLSSSSAAAVAAASSSLISASHPALQSVPSSVINSNDFELVKALALAQHNFVISDPSLPDNPIVFASAGFYALTGYSPDEVIGRNCRFLQGAATDPRAIAAIRRGVVDGKDTAVCLINYKKDGTSFWNRFFIAALKSVDGKIVNYVGVQCQVSDALARVLVDMQSRRKNDADGTPLTAEAEVAVVSVLSAAAAASSSSSSSSSTATI